VEQQRPPPRGKWPVLASMAERDWQTVAKFVLIVLAAQMSAITGVLLYLLLHR
jgi:hypothetical protein